MKKSIRTSLVVLFSLTGVVSCTEDSAVTTESALTNTKPYASYDINRDGIYSGDEFTSYVDRNGFFTNRDLNKDGLIDANEYNELGLDDDFGDWDTDGDSYINSSEFSEGAFKSFDDNEDGHWDDGEWDDAGDAGLFDV